MTRPSNQLTGIHHRALNAKFFATRRRSSRKMRRVPVFSEFTSRRMPSARCDRARIPDRAPTPGRVAPWPSEAANRQNYGRLSIQATASAAVLWVKTKPSVCSLSGTICWSASSSARAASCSTSVSTNSGTGTRNGRCSPAETARMTSFAVAGVGPTRLTGPDSVEVSRCTTAAASSGCRGRAGRPGQA